MFIDFKYIEDVVDIWMNGNILNIRLHFGSFDDWLRNQPLGELRKTLRDQIKTPDQILSFLKSITISPSVQQFLQDHKQDIVGIQFISDSGKDILYSWNTTSTLQYKIILKDDGKYLKDEIKPPLEPNRYERDFTSPND